jgi:hypothetical protein
MRRMRRRSRADTRATTATGPRASALIFGCVAIFALIAASGAASASAAVSPLVQEHADDATGFLYKGASVDTGGVDIPCSAACNAEQCRGRRRTRR